MKLEQAQHKQQALKEYEIPYPGGGGLNTNDLEFDQLSNQSPSMLNMIIKNGAFGKRYGQTIYDEFEGEIYSTGYYKREIYLHVGDKIICFNTDTKEHKEIYSGLTNDPGIFINYNKALYYLNKEVYLEYDGEECKKVEPYAPDICINRKPDGTYSDLIEDYNRLGAGFKNTFNGDGTAKAYTLTATELDDTPVTATVGTTDMVETTDFTVDREKGVITFKVAPTKGQNNVVITAYKTDQKYIDSIMGCKYHANYGGNNNSRLFLAGNGNAVYYYTDTFDASYFPESNYATLGNGEYDITGFGGQYDKLIVFKENEMYAISYYNDSEDVMKFASIMINDRIGCDAPESIQLLDNRLTWIESNFGVCALVSTELEDERNVQYISRNINGGVRASGLLTEKDLTKCKTVSWQGKYIISINGNCYVWDYLNTPYAYTKDPDTDAKRLSWYKWDNFFVNDWIIDDKHCFYTKENKLVELDNSLSDFGEPINAYYQTPMLQFSLVNYLKTVKSMYVLVRGDTPAKLQIKYITEENPNGELDSEDIEVYTRLWDTFAWNTFGYTIITFAKTFARKCSMKKIQMLGVLFSNDELDKDMSISTIKFTYLPIKKIK